MSTRRNLARILWLEPLWVLALGIPLLLPGRFLPLALHPYLLVILLLFWPLRWFEQLNARRARKRARLVGSPITLPVCLLLLWLPVTIWISTDRAVSWEAAGYLLWGVALYQALIHWVPAYRYPAVVAGLLLLCVTGLALVAPLLVNWKTEQRLFDLALYDDLQALQLTMGETIHANVLAGALVIVLPLLLSLTLFLKAPTGAPPAQGVPLSATSSSLTGRWVLTLRIVFALLLMYTLVLTILTQSRGAYLAAAGAFGIILVIRWPRLLVAVPLLIFGVAVSLRQIGWQLLVEQSSRDGTLAGWGGRLEIWQHSLTAIQDFPFTGIGIGTFTTVFPRLYPLSFPVERYPHAHNLILQIGIDMGLPGIIAYMALLINLYAMLFALLRSCSLDSVRWVLTVGALGSCVAISLHGLLDAVIWGTKIAFLPWLVYALITVLFLQHQASRSS